MARSLLTGLLWLLLTLLLLASAARLLPACGIELFGHRLAWCAAGAGSSAQTGELVGRIADLEARIAGGDGCGGAAARPSGPTRPASPPAVIGGPVPPGPGSGGAAPARPAAPSAPPPAGEAEPPGASAVPPAAGEPPAPGAQPRAEPPAPDGQGAASPPPAGSDQAATPPSPSPAACDQNAVAPAIIVLAIDHSRSMGLPVDADPAEIDRLETAIATGDDDAVLAARARYNALIAGAGRKRIDALREAVATTLAGLGPDDEVDALSFAGCGQVASHGVFAADRRGELNALIGRLRIRPATPLALAVEKALDEAASQSARAVVLVSDGRDTCEGDPCAVARAAGRAVPVHVVAVGKPDDVACLAEATGGTMFPAAGAGGIAAALDAAMTAARGGAACGARPEQRGRSQP